MTDAPLSPLRRALRAAGLVETHYHVGPELVDRRDDVATLAVAARRASTTVVLKNHTYPTTPLAALARAHYGVQFLGSVVLNHYVGGLNPYAVRGAASGNRADPAAQGADPRFVVYMPTVHAAAHLRVLGHAFDQRWSTGGLPGHAVSADQPVDVFTETLQPYPELVAVLHAIADTGAVLATGHLSAGEIMRLVPMALAAGVTRVLLTHPHYPSIELSDDQLVELTADHRVYAEHCLAIHTIEEVSLHRFAASIRATGPRQVVLTTDFGQVRSQPLPDGLLTFADTLYPLLADDVSLSEFVAMFSTNGRRALDLPDPAVAP
ncbi:MAG: DUF6282 family protein [Janthinobacterium lividum]